MNRMSRRTLVGGAILLPVAGFTLNGVTASRQESSPDASPGASPEASPMASPSASPVAGAEIVIDAMDIEFSMTEIRVPADSDTTITLVNKGVLEHDLYVEALDLMTELLKPGEEGSIVVNAPAGEYEYWCTVAGHKELGMAGILIAE